MTIQEALHHTMETGERVRRAGGRLTGNVGMVARNHAIVATDGGHWWYMDLSADDILATDWVAVPAEVKEADRG
jgi:hypothetical protein